MAIKLNEVQVALISAAAQRDDRHISLPDGRGKAAARKAASALLASGMAREVRAQGEAPVWRHDNDNQRAFALKLTALGAKAIEQTADDSNAEPQPKPHSEKQDAPKQEGHAALRNDEAIARNQSPAALVAPRTGTKIDKVVKMLSRPEGATLEALAQASGWLLHTTSAALTGLRKRGYNIERSRDLDAGPSVYRLMQPARTEA